MERPYSSVKNTWHKRCKRVEVDRERPHSNRPDGYVAESGLPEKEFERLVCVTKIVMWVGMIVDQKWYEADYCLSFFQNTLRFSHEKAVIIYMLQKVQHEDLINAPVFIRKRVNLKVDISILPVLLINIHDIRPFTPAQIVEVARILSSPKVKNYATFKGVRGKRLVH